MPRPDLDRVPSFYHNYIRQVEYDDVHKAIHELGKEFIAFIQTIPPGKYDYAYAPGKWTLKEVFQHIIDTERIMTYRALCIARKESQSLPGFDENNYAANSKASTRAWNDMVEEFSLVRKATKYLFASFNDEQLQATGIANNKPVYVLGLGFIIAGHCQHHANIIRERYF